MPGDAREQAVLARLDETHMDIYRWRKLFRLLLPALIAALLTFAIWAVLSFRAMNRDLLLLDGVPDPLRQEFRSLLIKFHVLGYESVEASINTLDLYYSATQTTEAVPVDVFHFTSKHKTLAFFVGAESRQIMLLSIKNAGSDAWDQMYFVYYDENGRRYLDQQYIFTY